MLHAPAAGGIFGIAVAEMSLISGEHSVLFPRQVQYTVDEAAGRTFDYVEGGASARLLAPPLNYVAPELIASNGASAPPPLSPASDMFSLGADLLGIADRCHAISLPPGRHLHAAHLSVCRFKLHLQLPHVW